MLFVVLHRLSRSAGVQRLDDRQHWLRSTALSDVVLRRRGAGGAGGLAQHVRAAAGHRGPGCDAALNRVAVLGREQNARTSPCRRLIS